MYRDPPHLVQMTSSVVSIYCQSIPGPELWNALQSRAHIVGIIYMAERADVDVGEGNCMQRSFRERMCVSWTLITWCSLLSDVILMTQRSIGSLLWTPRESCLLLPPSLLRVGLTKSWNHHLSMLLTRANSQRKLSRSHNYVKSQDNHHKLVPSLCKVSSFSWKRLLVYCNRSQK